ncbi:MAG: ribonuclease HI [Gaiellaceae bacterium MAG52_C11]|nr:ribonuclease HI [Candidatus Gaiellasilicea maunaloa]
MSAITIYTDGACMGNPGPGGWAAIVVQGGRELELSGGMAHTTNNQMELQAVISGLKALKKSCKVSVCTDSKYITKAFNDDWISDWKLRAKDGIWRTSSRKPVANQALWEELIRLVSLHEVEAWDWVKGHNKHVYNERCDALAVTARDAAYAALLLAPS